MKTKGRNAVCILCAGLALAACRNGETVPDCAGDNRAELEKVLAHYKSDPLKLEAARFLIENMDAHYYYGGETVDAYYRSMDSLFRHRDGDRGFWNLQYDSIIRLYGAGLDADMARRRCDAEHLKAGFLIAAIDSAFSVWRRNWNKQYDFDVFCRYVLPYRVGEEPPSPWRAALAMPPGEVADFERHTANLSYAYDMANRRLQWLRSIIYYPPRTLPDFPLTMLDHIKMGSCKEYAHLCVALLRTAGIPSAVDFVPQWGNRSLGHEWCAVLLADGVALPFAPGERLGEHFAKRKEDRLPKVFRQTFEKRPESLRMQAHDDEVLPKLFDTPCLADVTDEYVETSDVTVRLEHPRLAGSRFAYLAVFNNREWKIVHWGRIHGDRVEFNSMGRDVVYLPVYYNKSGMLRAGDAFLLDKHGRTHSLEPDESRRRTVRLKRKFRDDRSNQFLQAVTGGKFQVANREDFSDSLTIHVIPKLEDNCYHMVAPSYEGEYRYFRYLSPDWSRGNMAELYTFGTDGDTLRPRRLLGNFHVRPWCGLENLFDGNVLSFYDSHDVYNVWYGWELERPGKIARIRFLPRNDDNFIREGENYELLYWKRGRWVSLGHQPGNDEGVLTYGQAPLHALFLLRNHTKGQEERIFTYEQGRQVWW